MQREVKRVQRLVKGFPREHRSVQPKEREAKASSRWNVSGPCYDVLMVRSTSKDDASRAKKADRARQRQAARRAAEHSLVTEDRNGLRVVRLDPRSPKVTAALVDRLREDLP